MFYRAYKIEGQFSKLLIDNQNEKYTHIASWINDKKGNKEKIDNKHFDSEKSDDRIENRQNSDAHQSSIVLDKEVSIPEEYSENDYVEVTRQFVHSGGDDWLLFSYELPHPTDGVIFKIRCEKGIYVEAFRNYGMKHHKNEGFQRSDGMILKYNNWLQEGAGISVLFRTNKKMM